MTGIKFGATASLTMQKEHDTARNNSKDSVQAVQPFNVTKMQCRAVRRKSVESMLRQRYLARAGCLSVPFTISFFIFFTLSVMLHEDVRKLFLAEYPLRKFIQDSKGLGEINDISELWGFMQEELMPTLFRQTDRMGVQLPQKEWGRVLGKQQVKGGVLVEQYRMPGSPKPGTTILTEVTHNVTAVEELLHFDGEGMIDAASVAHIDDEDLERLLMPAGEVGGPSSIGAEADPRGPPGKPENSYPIFFFEQESYASTRERLAHIEAYNWVDAFTVQLSVKFILVNSVQKTVQRVSVRFVFPDSGGMYTAVNQDSVFRTSYRNIFSMGVDFVLLLLLMYISFQEGREVWESLKILQLKKYFLDVWNVLDWATIFCGWCLVLMFAVCHFQTDAIEKVLFDEAHEEAVLNMKYWKTMYELQFQADRLAFIVMWYRIFISDYMLLIMFRLFKAFKGHPRLAVVTNTIKVAGSDLFHFGIVFTCVFLAFAYSGTLLFGRRLSGFSTFSKSCGTCFSIACGEFQWAVMAEEHEITSTLWFWGFMVLIYLVMLNMVLAIVMNVYTRVHEEAIAGDPIWKSVSHLWSKYRHLHGPSAQKAETQISDPVLIEGLKELRHKEHITAKTLRDAIPNLSNYQACQILYDAEMWEMLHKTQGMSMSEAMSFIRQTHTKVESLVHCIDSRAATIKRLKWKMRRLIRTAIYDGRLKQLANSLRDNEAEMKKAKQFELSRRISRADTFLEGKKDLEPAPESPRSPLLKKGLSGILNGKQGTSCEVKESKQTSNHDVQMLSQRIHSLEKKMDRRVGHLETMVKDMHNVIMSSFAQSLSEHREQLAAAQMNSMMMPSHSAHSFNLPVQSHPNVVRPVMVQPTSTPGPQSSLYHSGGPYTQSAVSTMGQPYPVQWSPSHGRVPERHHTGPAQMPTWQQTPDSMTMAMQPVGVVPDNAGVSAVTWPGLPPVVPSVEDLAQAPAEFEAGMIAMPTSAADQLRSAVSACVQEDFATSVRAQSHSMNGHHAAEGLFVPGQWVPASHVAPSPMYESRSEAKERKRRAKSKQVNPEPEAEGSLTGTPRS